MELIKLRTYGKVNDSIVDGPGLRYSIFTQGCLHRCKGCHNPKSHDLSGGYLEDIRTFINEIESNPLLDGVTISGGEPFLQPIPLIELLTILKEKNIHIMIYSGYTFEEILELGIVERKLLSLCDILVDGRFEESLKSLSLIYKGSSNQRIIDVQKSLKEKQVYIQEINEYGEFVK
ncbi:MAG: anaerobic ribonucleoside-triphosphate reductase activating protein [Coprobacillus sp.]